MLKDQGRGGYYLENVGVIAVVVVKEGCCLNEVAEVECSLTAEDVEAVVLEYCKTKQGMHEHGDSKHPRNMPQLCENG